MITSQGKEMSEESISKRVEKRQPKHIEEKCNICDAPREVAFQERDDDTGKIETRTHVVECNGHVNIPGYLWNKHKDWTKFQLFFAQQRRNTKQTS
jgi:hypothetical protein